MEAARRWSVSAICDENQVQAAVDKAVETFGGIDIQLGNNASPIQLSGTNATSMKRSKREREGNYEKVRERAVEILKCLFQERS